MPTGIALGGHERGPTDGDRRLSPPHFLATPWGLESGVRSSNLFGRATTPFKLGRSHISELDRNGVRVLVKCFGLADTARIGADLSITLLSQLSK
jgi:hypothetical protein